MGLLQKTASKAGLLLQCPRPFSEGVEVERQEPGEAAVYGTRFHTGMAEWFSKGELNKGGFLEELLLEDDDLLRHIEDAARALEAWMRPDGNPFGLAFKVVSVEQSAGVSFEHGYEGEIDVNHCAAGLIDPDGEHRYEGCSGNPNCTVDADVYGTADVLLEAEMSSKRERTLQKDFSIKWSERPVIFRVVLDHKTGSDYRGSYSKPASDPQMQALGLLFNADAVAILHSPRGAPPVIYSEPFRSYSLKEVFLAAIERVDEGFLRVGPECRFCPARGDCPAKQGELIASTEALVKKTLGSGAMLTGHISVDPGAFHLLLSELSRLEKLARAEIRAAVEAGEVIERPDGKTLVIQKSTVERLPSKKALRAALGNAAAEELFVQWRALGIMVEEEEERLVAR